MARARSIKPRFFTNETLCSLNPLARLLFAGLWTIADRDGRLEDRPKRIKAELLPYDRCDADRLLQDLHDNDFIHRYAVDNERYIQVTTWRKHQCPHIKESASTIPAPCKHHASTGNSGASPSLYLNPEPLTLNPEPERAAFDLEPWAERLYSAHIKRRDRALVNAACLGVLRRCQQTGSDPEVTFGEIESCLKAWNATEGWREKNGQYAPKLAQWIEDRGYEQWPVATAPARLTLQDKLMARIIEAERKEAENAA